MKTTSNFTRLLILPFAVLLLHAFATEVAAQTHLQFSGMTFGDYYYVLSSPDEEREEMNGFDLRRTYLTVDFDLSRGFDGRARLEANSGNVSNRGMDAFIKDLYLRWTSNGGHAFRIGIIPVPHWEETSEAVWAYRSLEATIMDVQGVSASRDFGVRVDGPLVDGDRLNYSVMFGNNNGQRPEVDRGKRVYAGLHSRPSEQLVLGASFDYAGYTDLRESGITVHGFVGYEGERFSVGVEPFWNQIEFENESDVSTVGISLFAHASVTDTWRVVGRVDFSEVDAPLGDVSSILGIVGISYEPIRNVRLMPNLWISKIENQDEAEARGRFTFEFRF